MSTSAAHPKPFVAPLPLVPLACLAVGLLACGIPMLEGAPGWTYGILLAAAAWRLAVAKWQLPLPSLPLRLLMLGGGLLALYLKFQKFLGIEPGFGSLLILVALKLLESRTSRDFQVLVLLGYFLCLCVLFFAQDLNSWIFVALNCLLVTASAVRLRLHGTTHPMKRSWRVAAALLVQALPILLILFVFFPRFRGEFRLHLGGAFMGATGFSENLQPGSVASLVQSDEVAFRVSFPQRNAPPPNQLYWRGLVFWAGSGLNWARGKALRDSEPLHPRLNGTGVRQRIQLEPYGSNFLFALDRPVGISPTAESNAGQVYRASSNLFTRYTYEAVSTLSPAPLALPDDHRKLALATTNLSPDVLELAQSFQADGATPRQIVDRALTHFRRGGFSYSLSPGQFRSLDQFLFEGKTGFCEHYAGAFATLMRAAGVPARVIGGYLGGEYSPLGDYYIVRQSDAHAWCEVWLAETGWLRVDPTSVIAPMRMSLSLQSYLERERGGSGFGQQLPVGYVWRDTFGKMRLYWDNLSYQWDQRIMTYDKEHQRALLVSLGLGSLKGGELLAATLASLLIPLSLVILWLRRTRRRRQARGPGQAEQVAAQRLFSRFCRRAAKAGVPRLPAEGPLAYVERVAARFPAEAEPLRALGALYAAIRYSAQPPPLEHLAAAVRTLPRLQNTPMI